MEIFRFYFSTSSPLIAVVELSNKTPRLAERNGPPLHAILLLLHGCHESSRPIIPQQLHSAVCRCSRSAQPNMRAATPWQSCYIRIDCVQNRHSGTYLCDLGELFWLRILIIHLVCHQWCGDKVHLHITIFWLLFFWTEPIYMHKNPSIR